LAGGHGVGWCEKMSPLPPRGDPGFFDILNTKSCILMHSLAPKIGTASVFIETPKHYGNEDCSERLPNEA